MAYQAPFRHKTLERNAHRIRVHRDARASDPTMTPDERAFRIERLRSPLMAREHDEQVAAHLPGIAGDVARKGALTLREAITQDDDDVSTFYPGA